MKHPVTQNLSTRAFFIITIKRESSEVDWICCIFAKFVAYLLPMDKKTMVNKKYRRIFISNVFKWSRRILYIENIKIKNTLVFLNSAVSVVLALIVAHFCNYFKKKNDASSISLNFQIE